MSPYFNDSGEMNPESDDLYTDVADHAAPSPEEPKPAEPASDAPPVPPGFPALATAAELEQFRAEFLADPWHPMHKDDALAEHYAQAVSRLAGHEDGDEVIGTLHPDGRLLAPEDTPEVRVNELSEAAQEAGFSWDGELLEELVAATDESGLPRHYVEPVFQSVAEAAETFALDDDLNTPEAGLAELVRTEGSGRARQIVTDAQALLDRLGQSGVPAFVQAADSLADVSNHPGVLVACATLYRELCNLPPSGPWEQMLLGTAERWAAQQEAAQRRAATAEPEDLTREVGRFGRP